ncbi:unnamed protein product [Rotaria sordida]|uniref:F-box domain-containing protein n=1 Tax=Rotaria sordida TaxID=392033 RepID=A0A819DDU5_9BILA|nr:unnamed protein product [Rotaria sordida]CAF3832976.1 unnamed protein product [Rotaria sordida]
MDKLCIRSYIKTRWLLGLTAAQVHDELIAGYRPGAVSYSTVTNRIKLHFQTHMFQVKRRLSNTESSKEETKKYRTTYDDKKIINCFENLSNELFYEVFDYLEGCDLFKAFSNLNSRFQAMVTSSSLRLKIDLRFHPEVILQYCSTCVVVPNKHR